MPNAEIVNVLPQPKAGSSFATAAYESFRHPVALEEIRADAGLDIGGTLIGMHLKKVAVPVRLKQDHIGQAIVLAARVRPKFIGGANAFAASLRPRVSAMRAAPASWSKADGPSASAQSAETRCAPSRRSSAGAALTASAHWPRLRRGSGCA